MLSQARERSPSTPSTEAVPPLLPDGPLPRWLHASSPSDYACPVRAVASAAVIFTLLACEESELHVCCSDPACPVELPDAGASCDVGGGRSEDGTPRARCFYCDPEYRFGSANEPREPIVMVATCFEGSFFVDKGSSSVCIAPDE